MDAKLFELDTKMEALRGQMAGFPNSIVNDYQERLNVSWIFHESAIEGVVLSYSELKAAIDHRIISDVSYRLRGEARTAGLPSVSPACCRSTRPRR